MLSRVEKNINQSTNHVPKMYLHSNKLFEVKLAKLKSENHY